MKLGENGNLNPILNRGGGKFAPDATNLSAISVPIALGSPKFMTLFHSMSDPS